MQGKRAAEQRAMLELERLQAEMELNWLDRSLPEAWHGILAAEEISPAKTRISVRLDADMVRWFRKMGPGYGRLMNRVLRVYWTALLAGLIKAYYTHDTTDQIMMATRAMLEERR